MDDKTEKPARKRRTGRPPKSGAYSPLCRQEFLEEYPDIRRYIQKARDGLVDDQCRRFNVKSEDELPAAVRLSIDRQVSKLSLSRQIEVYIMRHGLLRRDRLKGRNILEAEPIALFWLNLQNSLDRGLMNLAVEPSKESDEFDAVAYAAEYDRQKAERGAREPGRAGTEDGEKAGHPDHGDEPTREGEGEGEGHEQG